MRLADEIGRSYAGAGTFQLDQYALSAVCLQHGFTGGVLPEGVTLPAVYYLPYRWRGFFTRADSPTCENCCHIGRQPRRGDVVITTLTTAPSSRLHSLGR